MTRLEQLEEAVSSLTQTEFISFRRWFEEFSAARWDRQIEDDLKAGKLDELAAEALTSHEAGETSEL